MSNLLPRFPFFRPRASRAVVAVVRFGAAGDVIRIAPAIDALARAWPHARRLIVTHARYAPLVKRCHTPLTHVALVPGESLWSLASRLKREGVTHVLDLHATMRSRALSLLLWPRLGVRIAKRDAAEWARVRLAHAPHRPRWTCAQRQQRALAALTGVDAPLPPLSLVRPSIGDSTMPCIGLSPGAQWATKRWPPERWGELAQQLIAAGFDVTVFGSEPERELVQCICRVATQAHACIGLSWDAFCAALVRQHVFVCGDSGPLHLASGLQVATVGLFLSTPEEAFDDVASVVVKGDVSCRPCSFYGRRACPRDHGQCSTQVSVAHVMAAITRCLSSLSSANVGKLKLFS